MPTIEDKEIKGITAKVMVWLIIHTAIIVGTACAFYFTLKSDIEKVVIVNNSDEKYLEERFRSIELNYSLYQKQLDALRLTNEALQVQINELNRLQAERLTKK